MRLVYTGRDVEFPPQQLRKLDAKLEKVNKLLAALETMIAGGCLIAVSDVTVVKYEEHQT